MSNLTTDEMIRVAEVFTGAFDHTLQLYIDDTRAIMRKFAAEILLWEKPYMLLTPEGASHCVNIVFGKELHRDFILMLSYVFFGRFGNDDMAVGALARNLARAATQQVPPMTGRQNQEHGSIIPKAIYDRMPNYETATATLVSNRWLMIILLIQLFIVVELPKEK